MTDEQYKAAEQRIVDRFILIFVAGVLIAAVLVTAWEWL
jgi:cation transport ATPase